MSLLAQSLPFAPTALRRSALLTGLALLLAGCAELSSSSAPRLNKEGAAAWSSYAVTPQNIAAVRARALDTVNNTRNSAGLGPVSLDDSLNRAAERHSASMSRQKRAWAFGEDGSSPIHRAAQAGFQGSFLGEMVSETYQSEVQAIATWAAKPELRAILLDPRATRIGLGAFQDPDMKLWWTLNVGQ